MATTKKPIPRQRKQLESSFEEPSMVNSVRNVDRMIHLTSADRDITKYSDPAECVLDIDPIHNVQDVELLQFEIANPRNTVETGINNTFVFSEYSDSTYRVFVAYVPEGTYDARLLTGEL